MRKPQRFITDESVSVSAEILSYLNSFLGDKMRYHFSGIPKFGMSVLFPFNTVIGNRLIRNFACRGKRNGSRSVRRLQLAGCEGNAENPLLAQVKEQMEKG